VLVGTHTFGEGAMRPARAALSADTGIGDSLPRSRPTFATWLELSMLGSMFVFSVIGAMLGTLLARGGETPVLAVVIGCALTLGLGVPITVGAVV